MGSTSGEGRADGELFRRNGLSPGQVVQGAVTAHRGRFGVEIELIEPRIQAKGFVDFVMFDAGRQRRPEEFPPIGTVLELVPIGFIWDDELRLSARPSEVAHARERESDRATDN